MVQPVGRSSDPIHQTCRKRPTSTVCRFASILFEFSLLQLPSAFMPLQVADDELHMRYTCLLPPTPIILHRVGDCKLKLRSFWIRGYS
jgi:hypothetical protein